jgi:hypothetical protein
MAERTRRGEEDRKQQDEQVTGEPVAAATAGQGGTQGGNTTRDEGVAPANDDRRDGRGAEKKSGRCYPPGHQSYARSRPSTAAPAHASCPPSERPVSSALVIRLQCGERLTPHTVLSDGRGRRQKAGEGIAGRKASEGRR